MQPKPSEISDLYERLGVLRDASAAEIRVAFIRLVKMWHPDVHRGDPQVANAEFIAVREAFEVLSDQAKRTQYDRTHGHSTPVGDKSYGQGFRPWTPPPWPSDAWRPWPSDVWRPSPWSPGYGQEPSASGRTGRYDDKPQDHSILEGILKNNIYSSSLEGILKKGSGPAPRIIIFDYSLIEELYSKYRKQKKTS